MGWLNDLFTGVASLVKTLGVKTKVEPLEPMTDESMGWGAGRLADDGEPLVMPEIAGANTGRPPDPTVEQLQLVRAQIDAEIERLKKN